MRRWPPVLRKCLLLGGRAGSMDLRESAKRELEGHDTTDDLPDYRTVGASILMDGTTARTSFKRLPVSTQVLPEFARDVVREEVSFALGVGQIEAMIGQARSNEGGDLCLMLPGMTDLVRFMNARASNPWDQVTHLYWSVSASFTRGDPRPRPHNTDGVGC